MHVVDDKQGWVLLPEVFSGDGDFDAWLYHFESVSTVNEWSDRVKGTVAKRKANRKSPRGIPATVSRDARVL